MIEFLNLPIDETAEEEDANNLLRSFEEFANNMNCADEHLLEQASFLTDKKSKIIELAKPSDDNHEVVKKHEKKGKSSKTKSKERISKKKRKKKLEASKNTEKLLSQVSLLTDKKPELIDIEEHSDDNELSTDYKQPKIIDITEPSDDNKLSTDEKQDSFELEEKSELRQNINNILKQ